MTREQKRLEHGLPWRSSLRRMVTHYVGTTDAEDVLQQVHFAAWNLFAGGETVKSERAFRSLLFTIAKRQAINWMLKSRRDRVSQAEMIDTYRPSANDEEQRVLLQDLVEKLPPKERTVWALVVWEGYSVREAAALLGVSRSTLHRRLAAARAKVLAP